MLVSFWSSWQSAAVVSINTSQPALPASRGATHKLGNIFLLVKNHLGTRTKIINQRYNRWNIYRNMYLTWILSETNQVRILAGDNNSITRGEKLKSSKQRSDTIWHILTRKKVMKILLLVLNIVYTVQVSQSSNIYSINLLEQSVYCLTSVYCSLIQTRSSMWT